MFSGNFSDDNTSQSGALGGAISGTILSLLVILTIVTLTVIIIIIVRRRRKGDEKLSDDGSGIGKHNLEISYMCIAHNKLFTKDI